MLVLRFARNNGLTGTHALSGAVTGFRLGAFAIDFAELGVVDFSAEGVFHGLQIYWNSVDSRQPVNNIVSGYSDVLRASPVSPGEFVTR